MKLSLAILAAAAPSVVTGKPLKNQVRARALAGTDLSGVEVKASSKTGNELLSKARRLDGDDEYTWIAGYSLKFHSCATNEDYYGGYFENDNGNNYNYNQNGNNGNNYYNNDQDEYAGLYQQKLVHFKLCPSDTSCWRCKNGADYVVELGVFAQAMLQAKMTADEYDCNRVREGCDCEGASSEYYCLMGCFKNAGVDSSVCDNSSNDRNDDNMFSLQEAMECARLEVDDEDEVKAYIWANTNRGQAQNNGYYDANGNGQQDMQEQMENIDGDIYVGPYCSGNKVLLGLYLEETCSVEAPSGLYEATHYGAALPYSKDSVLGDGCISCKEPKEVDYNNYWDNQDPDEVTEVCTELYEVAGKCEENLDGYYPNRDVTGCGFISNLKSDRRFGSGNVPAKVFAGIFAVTTLVLGAIAATLFKKNRRQNVSLAGEPIIS